MSKARLDLSGRTFGRWRVMPEFKRIRTSGGHSVICWRVVCSCPLGTSKWIPGPRLTRARQGSKSCGCLQKELLAARTRKDTPYTCRKDTDGPNPLKRIWMGIISRCLNPMSIGYHRYGGRGITICDRWRYSLRAFGEDIPQRPSKDHTLHRIDGDKGYEPGNVVWLTRKEHSMLHMNSDYVIVDGIRDSTAATCKRLGIDRVTFAKWLGRGFTHQEIADQVRLRTARNQDLFPFLRLDVDLSDSSFHALVTAFLDDLSEGTDVHVKAAKELCQREAAYQNKYRERKRLGLV
jgi:hypothetical protein